MPTLVEINGIDEGGKLGEDIWFVRVGTRIDSEIQLLVRNLDHFDKLMVSQNDLRGRDEKNLMRYVTDMFDDSIVDMSVFRMRPQTQIGILKDYLGFLHQDLFRDRGVLIERLTKTASELEGTEPITETNYKEALWEVVQELERFGNFPFVVESFVKSYGMREITAKLDSFSSLFRTTISAGTNRMLVVQIDGGYPFAFWWQDLLESPNLVNIKKGSLHVSGISQGDENYPQLSVAGTIACTLNRFPHRTHFIPAQELTYEENKIDAAFYQKHTIAVSRPTFQNRIVFVGQIDPDLRNCIPYILHRSDRRKTYEPYHVETSAESFFRRFGSGSPENTLVIFGKLTSTQNRQDSWYCKSKKFEYEHLIDLKARFETFCSEIESEIDILHQGKRTELSGKFQRFKQKCLSEFR